ncbi:Lipase maturation factor 1 [Armadillidium nasatum]|uniref:Lipase maturation factor n=1 Tax=Armadillidium nasatum TaxID=96803 RepID=A0A5N5T230_9CRUS|nr:Lipase maturation factor 1 [Armadillidium nasatum]
MSWVSVWGLRWLIVRIMLGAGLIKLRGDRCWRELTCMDYHYEVILIISGNLSFLNWLTIVPSIAFFDDKCLAFLFSRKMRSKVSQLQISGGTEGTHSEEPTFPNATWLEYEFKCKPGNLKRRPCLISPYHYRLDWLMYEQNPWLVHLAGRFLKNDGEINGLIEYNPFLDENRKPPLHIKADLYLYNYAPIGSAEAARGQWYKRKYVRNYLPPVNLKLLKSVFREMGWQRTR